MASSSLKKLSTHLLGENPEEDAELAAIEASAVEVKSTTPSRLLLIFSALLLVAFVGMKSTLSLLLEACSKAGGGHYPFVIQTVTLCAFMCQICFYTLQTMNELGVVGGLKALIGCWKQMGPAIFYSTLVALSTLLQSMSQSYINASLYIILMQLTLVLVALGDRFILNKVSNIVLWIVVLAQASIVVSYTMIARAHDAENKQASESGSAKGAFPSSDDVDSSGQEWKQVIGIILCLSAETCSACGSILQQRFMQMSAAGVLTSIKLCYQHIFGAVVMIITSLMLPSNVTQVWEHGFFAGWDSMTVVTALSMWLYFLVASSVTAYVSALAGAVGASVVIGVIALYEVQFENLQLWPIQIVLMCALFLNTGFYTFMKDRHNQNLIREKQLEEEARYSSAMSTVSNKAQVKLCRQYSSDNEINRVALKWSRSNPALAGLAEKGKP